MFTAVTFQEWEATPQEKRLKLLQSIIRQYKRSPDFLRALEANNYFTDEDTEVEKKVILKSQTRQVDKYDEDGHKYTENVTAVNEIPGARVPTNIFKRLVIQQNQHLLSNGVTLGKQEEKDRLGLGFDRLLARCGEKALLHGVCWGFWNLDHMEIIEAAADSGSGFVALVDEETSAPRLGVQFWQVGRNRPMYVRLFEEDGVTTYKQVKNLLQEHVAKRAYVLTISADVIGEQVVRAENYGRLPLVPLYGNEERKSELSRSMKRKIDAYDIITSDFVDNLQQANEIYWVLNNFGGTYNEMADMIESVRKSGILASYSDGTPGGTSTAEPHTFQIPTEARKVALELLEKAMYKDFMARNLDDVSGGSLTNVAILTASTNLELKCDRYEWQVFDFVQSILRLAGIETEKIVFKRQEIVNRSEVVDDIQSMRQDIDDETALKLNPYIMPEEIETILANRDAKVLTGLSGTAAADRARGADDGQGDT